MVTLPHNTIGQRWTQAYYKIMGIEEFIAMDQNDYVKIAVETANMLPEKKEKMREKIKSSAHKKLYRNDAGVQYWINAFLDIATRPRNYRWKHETELVRDGNALRKEL